MLRDLLFAYTIVAFFYFALLNSLYLFLTLVAWRQMGSEVRARRYLGLEEVFRSPFTPGVSVLVPAFNEEAGIVESVRSLLSLRYPRHEVIAYGSPHTSTIRPMRSISTQPSMPKPVAKVTRPAKCSLAQRKTSSGDT